MRIHPTVSRLRDIGLSAMADALVSVANDPEALSLPHADWLGLLVDRERRRATTAECSASSHAGFAPSRSPCGPGRPLERLHCIRAPKRRRNLNHQHSGWVKDRTNRHLSTCAHRAAMTAEMRRQSLKCV